MTDATKARTGAPPSGMTAALALDDGTVLFGQGIGAVGQTVGEVCFNTSMTGYQEILTDPSYAGQIITFTFPHIGNVGTNREDNETDRPAARGLILRTDMTEPSNWRSLQTLDDWLKERGLIGLTGIDTRALTRRIRDKGAPSGCLSHAPDGRFDLDALTAAARDWPGLEGMDLAVEVSAPAPYQWDEAGWRIGEGYARLTAPRHHVVAIDYGIKRNILRCLADHGCRTTVMPATASAEQILAAKPDAIFLSNGPGDPAATGRHAVATVQALIASGKPMFGICLGHQILALALGASTEKLHMGHRGANQPVKDLTTDKVEITSQNHGFVVRKDGLPDDLEATHFSLFDGALEGFQAKRQPIFAVQYHPEASPGPQDSHYLFQRFVEMIEQHA